MSIRPRRPFRLPDGLIGALFGMLGLAAICAAGFIAGFVFAWAYLWLGFTLTGVSLILIGEMIKE